MPLSPDQMAYLSNTTDPATYAKLLRQQSIGQGFMQMGLQPDNGQMVSGHYVAPSPLARIANLATAYMGNKMANDAAGQVANAQAAGLQRAWNQVYGQPNTGYDNQVNQIDPNAPWMAGNVNPKPFSFNPMMNAGLMSGGTNNG